MTDRAYQLVFSGDIIPGEDLDRVKKNFAKILKIDPGQVERLFSGRSTVVKKGVDIETAQKFKSAFKKAGAILHIEPYHVEDSAPGPGAEAAPAEALAAPGEGETVRTRVGGWLALFVFTLVVSNPAGTIINLVSGYQETSAFFHRVPGLRNMIIADTALSLGLMAFSVYAGIALWKLKPGAVAVAKKYLLTALLYSLLVLALPFVFGLPERAAQAVFNELLKGVPGSILYVAIWYLYLLKSKRVRETYGTN